MSAPCPRCDGDGYTVAKVARHHGRRAIGVDLNPDYLDIAARRTQQLGLLSGEAA